MRVVVRHPATPPVDFDFVLELDPKPEIVYHVCEHAVPGRITVFDSDRFALGWCPSCQENVRPVGLIGAALGFWCCGDPGDCDERCGEPVCTCGGTCAAYVLDDTPGAGHAVNCPVRIAHPFREARR